MPELPEVETIRRDLHGKIIGNHIKRVDVRLKKIVQPHGAVFEKILAGSRITDVRRRAKLLAFDLLLKTKQRRVLLIHLKMTGQLVLKHKKKIIFGGHPIVGARTLPNKYSHVIFSFTNGDVLYFNDLRQFGYLKLVDPEEAAATFAAYGIEPLTPAFTYRAFEQLLKKNHTAKIKALLLNQEKVAGLGNIYVDEACFAARIRPSRTAGSLKPLERKALWRAIGRILALSIKYRGTSFNTYIDSDGLTGKFWQYLKVYGRAKELCKVCGGGLVKTVLAGRGTHYCTHCQK